MVKDITKIRQLVGRSATIYTPGGRQKRQLRPAPSMPKLKCLEDDTAQESISSETSEAMYLSERHERVRH